MEQFDYDNGFGDRVGRFKIDLYKALGDGDCGTWSDSVCDKPNMGCHDTREFFIRSFNQHNNSFCSQKRMKLFIDRVKS